MATLGSTPVRELSDMDLRKRLLALGYDVPVSVNREFLVKKLENVSAGGGGGGGKTNNNKRHSMAATPVTPASNSSPSSARKRKSLAVTPGRGQQPLGSSSHNVPSSPLGTPGQQQYMGSPASSIGMSTPSTPSPFVSRLNTPSPNNTPGRREMSPRYMNYYNYFKTSTPADGDGGGGGGDYVSYGRGRMSSPGSFNPVTSVAPPSRAERNGYTTTSGHSVGNNVLEGDSDWTGSHIVSKILVVCFILFFLIIGGMYISKSGVDPRGLTSDVPGTSGSSYATREPEAEQAPPPTPAPPPPPKKKDQLPPTSMVFPVCGLKGVDPQACIPKDVVKNSRTLFNALKEELTLRARNVGCQSDIQDQITLKEAKSLLYKLTELRKSEVDAAFQGMLLLVTENPRGGLSLQGSGPEYNEISSRDVESLDPAVVKIGAADVHPDFVCVIRAMFSSITLYATVAAGATGAGYLAWKGFKIYKSKKESEQEEIFIMVERVIELLYTQHELAESCQTTHFLAVNHIRDELLPPSERVKKEAFWNKVVNYISNHESRVREEVQHISGEEFKVWRWLPSASPLASKRLSHASSANNSNHRQRNRFSMPASPLASTSAAAAGTSQAGSVSNARNLYPSLHGMDDEDDAPGANGDNNSNNKWQGQAFETCEGSPNALPVTPTTCLKIRHMFTEKDGIKERARIERVILEKCDTARILHIGMDASSAEGCVYIRCLSKEDSRNAFNALHGWWYEGKLLSVKFLREERYFSRFPEAKSCQVPMRLPV